MDHTKQNLCNPGGLWKLFLPFITRFTSSCFYRGKTLIISHKINIDTKYINENTKFDSKHI
ncbi:hypothetical protein B0A69_13790 [Chryseobacterium shigense]|nr:hypothetical protein B0A69_13790 [Chryseobacterium shigense]